MTVKQRFKFSLNYRIFVAGIRSLLVLTLQVGFECATVKGRGLFKRQEFLNVT